MPSNKNSFYFPHDCNAKDDQKLLKLRGKFGLEGYGIFWMSLESMSTNDGYIDEEAIGGLAVTYGTAEAQLMAQLEFCVEIGLFGKNKHGYYSNRMNEHLAFRKERSESGKKGAKSRWEDSSAIAQPMAVVKTANAKERKGKEIKGNIYSSLSSLNEKTIGEVATQYSVSLVAVKRMAEELTLYCQSKGKRYANYKAALQNWVRRALEVKKISKIITQPVVQDDPTYDPVQARENLEKIREMRNAILK